MAESRVANGDIAPCRFVSYLATDAGGRVVQSEGSTYKQIFGISQAEERQPPYTGLQDGLCAKIGETFKVFTFPDKEVYLEIGIGGCNPGDFLKADANGCGVATVTNLDPVGARAKQSGIQGDRVPVDLLSPAQMST
jgi:hypothetical protein